MQTRGRSHLISSVSLLLMVGCQSWSAPPFRETDVPSLLKKLNIPLAVTGRPAWPKPPGRAVAVTLVPQVDQAGACVVSFGLPFGPGWIVDDARIRVADERGRELAVYTRPLARWWSEGKGDSLRSALVQFELAFPDRTPRTVTVTWDRARSQRRAAGVPVAETQITGHQDPPANSTKYLAFDYRVPRVLALLPADWLCASLLAWQQVPVKQNAIAPWFDQHLEASFPGSLRNMAAKDFAAHLFDRPATYFKLYVRSGEARHLLAGLEAVDFYLQHLGEDGFFSLKAQGDVKYTFTEGFALAYLLTGDERFRTGIDRALKAWGTHQRIEYKGEGFWTERHHGFGMLAYLHAYEVTGEKAYLEKAKRFFEAAWSLQTHPLHGGEPDGSWAHTGDSASEGGAEWVTSPWMSAFLTDAIWKYWMLTGDSRAPASLAMYAAYTLRNSIDPDGVEMLYLSVSPGHGEARGQSDDAHNMEGCYLLALGNYLTGGRDPAYRAAMDKLWPPMMKQDPNSTTRMFTWRFRETTMLVWFLQETKAR